MSAMDRISADLFVLHVELACPDAAAANRVLSGLEMCASATRVAGPGVPIYVFHRSAAVTQRARLTVPDAVGLEYFEFYLDGPAFWRHAESAEFLAGFNEATRPTDRIERRVYFAGNAPQTVMRTKVWDGLRASALSVVEPVLLNMHEAKGRSVEYVSLYLKTLIGTHSISDALRALSLDPSWVALLLFEHPDQPNTMRLMGVRLPVMVDRQNSHWSELRRLVSDVQGTSIAMSDAPLAEYLQHEHGWGIERMIKSFAGYPLHPEAGTYVPGN